MQTKAQMTAFLNETGLVKPEALPGDPDLTSAELAEAVRNVKAYLAGK